VNCPFTYIVPSAKTPTFVILIILNSSIRQRSALPIRVGGSRAESGCCWSVSGRDVAIGETSLPRGTSACLHLQCSLPRRLLHFCFEGAVKPKIASSKRVHGTTYIGTLSVTCHAEKTGHYRPVFSIKTVWFTARLLLLDPREYACQSGETDQFHCLLLPQQVHRNHCHCFALLL
jgi:hypothetical protein